ncbi:hypothetical protein DK261_20345 [Pseudomonas sp. RW409]|nr:hypothetical protein DK261_20345 [Pseudomonas sp. RW409]
MRPLEDLRSYRSLAMARQRLHGGWGINRDFSRREWQQFADCWETYQDSIVRAVTDASVADLSRSNLFTDL